MSGRKIKKRTKKNVQNRSTSCGGEVCIFILVTYFNILDDRKRKYEVNKSYILVMMFSSVFLQSIIKR